MQRTAGAIAIILLGLGPILGLALLRSALAAPLVVFNPSPSEPIGLYRLTAEGPAPGRLLVFHVPVAGQRYAKDHIGFVTRGGILKEIAAGAGSQICERNGVVFVNGRRRGVVSATDRNGVPLPQWGGCHRLSPGELFAFSTRIPNSYDSRYFGPVRPQNVVGVYTLLWTE